MAAHFHWKRASERTRALFTRDFDLLCAFITPEQQANITEEAHRALVKATWYTSHFDSVAANYREVTLRNCQQRFPHIWNAYVTRIQQHAFFSRNKVLMDDPHLLELAPYGHIQYHRDHVRLVRLVAKESLHLDISCACVFRFLK